MAAYDGGHASKRQRTDANGFSGGQKGRGSPVYGGNRSSGFNYSSNQKMERQSGDFNRREESPNNVLLFTVLNPQYPITVDVINTICSSSGKVLRIVIFKKQGVQAMVEFDSIQSAQSAKSSLNGCDIYSGCCTLKIEYARTNRLNVVRNDNESWDYTNPNLGQEPERRSAPLLPDPHYGGPGPKGHYGQDPPPSRRDPYDSYGRQPERGYPERGYAGGPAPHDPYGQGPADPYSRGPADPYNRGPADPYSRGGPGGPPPADQYGQEQPSAGMLQQGSVLMVYGLSMEHMNCTRIFNLFCLYGNVVRVKFLRSKEGSAMIQMGDPSAMERAIKNLNQISFFGNKLTLGYSKQAFLQDVPNPHDLSDGTKSFIDFMGSRNNRFTTPEAAAKNRIQPPGKTLYYWNAPPDMDEDKLCQLFEDLGGKRPDAIKIFPSKTEKSSTGLLEWDQMGEAVEALTVANHRELENPHGKYPFVLKLCFSGNPINRAKLGKRPPQQE